MCKLYNGQIFKNYKNLCEAMGWKYYNSGNSKKSQLKEFETYCKYHKEGNKFIIDEVYMKQKKKIDNRGRKSAEYIEMLEALIMGQMILNDSKSHNRLFIGKSVLMKETGLVNNNYSFCKRRPRKLAEYLRVSEDTVIEYFNLNNKSLMNDLERALKNLKNKGLIDLNISTIICKNETQVIDYTHNIIIDEYYEEIDNVEAETIINKIFVEATPKERNLIVNAKTKVLDDMKIDKITTVFATGRIKEFYNKMYEKLRVDIKELNYFFDAYDIVYEYDRIVKELNNIGYDDIDKDTKEFLMSVINCGIIKKIIVNSTKRHKKSLNTNYIGIPPKEHKKEYREYNRSRDEYINENVTISNNVINIKSDNIKSDLLKFKVK